MLEFNTPSEPLFLRTDQNVASVLLRWQPPQSSGGLPLLGYQVYMRVGSGPFELVGNATATTFEMQEFEAGKHLTYKVAAVN